MTTKVTINIDPTQKILLKRKLNNNGQAQLFFTNEIARLSEPPGHGSGRGLYC